MSTRYENFLGAFNDWFNMSITTRLYSTTFTAASNHTITSFKVSIAKFGSPTSSTWKFWRCDGSGFPVTLLDTITFDDTTLSTTRTFTEIFLTAELSLTSGTVYCISTQANVGHDGSNYLQWDCSNAGGVSGSEEAIFSDDAGSTWSHQATFRMSYDIYGNASAAGGAVPVPTLLMVGVG